ncbi:Peptidase M23 [Allomeiothermus silvanus DSM 9946]|uniref:Peptidase M23 n=1 Tax=Allomeiothermus silvanus (strain ATCC 700542 / DSM 9946 / NBRC 106475 / NCIMB 13440 / VI-R2) TaxID=526227 RepID=D7BGY2_ALLS1|nr:M23 family metallopeptidase [Allomeiothermus silvanus]ADH62136.1 Peptidase M23 [Allomeiothermus silvanus DSM 9946]
MKRPLSPLFSQTVAVPLWALVLLVLTVAGVMAYTWSRVNDTRYALAQVNQLSQQARKLQLELEAERARNQTYSVEAEQMRQNLKGLEVEINRLRKKAGLPAVQLIPQPTSTPPKPDTPKGPQGAGEPLDLGDQLLSLRAMMGNFAAEIEPLEEGLDSPLRDEPRRIIRPAPQLTRMIPQGAPLRVATYISSTFGYRTNPFGGYNPEFHNGLDFPAPTGTAVFATAPGTVEEVGWNNIFGLMILLDHGNGYLTLYGHLLGVAVSKGQQVGLGDLLGQVGSTGRSTGPHLHYSVFRYGVAVDPMPYVNGAMVSR